MTSSTIIGVEDMPARFHRADNRAQRAQRYYLSLVKLQIACLVVPVLAGTIDAVIDGEQAGLTVVSVLSLTLVAATRLAQRFSGYESDWHSARALAEAVRSLTWQYVAGGYEFDGMPDAEAQAEFDRRIGNLDTPVAGEATGSASDRVEVTTAMVALRAAPFEARRNAYGAGRLDDQRNWYRAKSSVASQRARTWDWLFVGSAALAIVFGFLRVSGTIEINLVSMFGLLAAVIGTWTGVSQYTSLAMTYGNTAYQLDPLAEQLYEIDEASWPAFVASSEDIMWREHSVWLLKRR